jgi:hypothetical protein
LLARVTFENSRGQCARGDEANAKYFTLALRRWALSGVSRDPSAAQAYTGQVRPA